MWSFPAAALDGHPLVSFIAQQLLAEVLACGSSEAAQQQLAGLLELLASAAACCAVPRFEATGPPAAAAVAESIVSTLVVVLQVRSCTGLEKHSCAEPNLKQMDQNAWNTYALPNGVIMV